jgi:hypothetical protein
MAANKTMDDAFSWCSHLDPLVFRMPRAGVGVCSPPASLKTFRTTQFCVVHRTGRMFVGGQRGVVFAREVTVVQIRF